MAKKSYIVAGPTASGKSDFAHELARRVGGTIINADSVQVYKGIENISASPLAGMRHGACDAGHEIDGVPYKLFSIKDLSEHISVSDYLEMARAEFDAADVPIFVGGSGYYIRALVRGLSPIPNVSPENRARAREMVAESPDKAREIAKCKFRDPQRTARALEVFFETGRPLFEWQRLPQLGALHPAPVKVLIMPPNHVLGERIRNRLKIMLDGGGMDEVRIGMNYPDRAIGIDEVGKYLRGEIGLDAALENWAARTRQYAKRQRTWFRHQFDADIVIPRVPANNDLEAVLIYN
ncbi:MAG: tRNA (adenosine(37)-N6)-dimethylallyltransferase MiaA [Rickettsiales bacterium]|jgi:tRNA dimethylallyltransferase|nr:tRNA (adenosine(37)-N6)-dimethylallyltransferase MiaA [Rickettsiales bacterium]